MLVGYVSDERYVALADVIIEFDRDGACVAVVRSTPRGAVSADLTPGTYIVTLVKEGFGPKHVTVEVGTGEPYQFRLLSNRLLGYAWPRWVRAGDRAEAFVHATEPYRLSLWRYGLDKECVRLLGWFDEHGPNAVMQITPDGDYTQTGVRWNTVGYGPPDVTRVLTAPERSGLYYLHAKGESGAFFSFPWVVAPRTPQARIAILASTNTWNAYNNFGGRSNYINADRLPPVPTTNARQELERYTEATFNVWRYDDDAYAPLSFQRPEPGNIVPEHAEVTDPIEGRLTSACAPGEWRLLAWLEREGFAYDFYADHHLHTGALDLNAYDVLAISVHPEYWSAAMYHRVRAWVHERGGRLMYLGGNGINCEVEFLDDATLHFKTQLLPVGGQLGMYDPRDPSILRDADRRRGLLRRLDHLSIQPAR
ncbi:MAG: carboxypeptidase-like regulatory domain-containing protein [Thermomicrobia bacterium]|nr:carboxypeptidase-like regulatory domain-containing protein [Thermomicrobia bacterium]